VLPHITSFSCGISACLVLLVVWEGLPYLRQSLTKTPSLNQVSKVGAFIESDRLRVVQNNVMSLMQYCVNKYLWEYTKTQHFDVRNAKIFWGTGTAPSQVPTPFGA